MRTGVISFDGKKHVLCFSVRVIKACAERYGSMEGIYDALSCEDEVKNLDEALWLLEQMMRVGDKYAKEHGMANEPPMTVDDMLDLCDIGDFIGMKNSIVSTIVNGRSTSVEADSPNAEATRGN